MHTTDKKPAPEGGLSDRTNQSVNGSIPILMQKRARSTNEGEDFCN